MSEPDFRASNGVVYGKELGVGAKVDVENPTYGFRDITGQVLTRGIGATDPAWTQIGSGPFYADAYAVNDVSWMVYHIPHDYAPGTDVFLHVHWFADGTDANVVKWQFIYTYAKGHGQQAFDETGTTITAEAAPPGVAYWHNITETAAVSVYGMEPDGILYVNLKRVTNGGSENDDTIFVLTLDVHYQSTNLGTKSRVPDFYA